MTSSAAHAQSSTDQGEHKHHVCTFSQFFGIYAALLLLTVLTVAASSRISGISLGTLSLVIAMAIASVKASLVMTVFMHLRWDTAINNIAFLSSLLFLSLLFLFTIADFNTRGRVDPVLEQSTPLDVLPIYKIRRERAGDDPEFSELKPYLQRY